VAESGLGGYGVSRPLLRSEIDVFFGLTVPLGALVVLGLLTYAVLTVQVLVGLRIIKLGKRHRVWHRRLAFTILGLATLHGLAGIAFYFGWRVI
jgi:hypothetical protein